MTHASSAGHDAAVRLLDTLARVEGSPEAGALAADIGRRLLPRLRDEGRATVVVLAGSSGVGTSTLLNSLVGRRVSSAGVLRPTTRVPVLVHHPDDDGQHAAASLPAPTTVVADEAVPPGLVLVDAPDLDSVEATGRELAGRLVAAADLWLAVTSPARYADAVPWAQLRRAVARRAPVAVVLNRVTTHDRVEVSSHLAALLQTEGLADSPLLVVAEQEGHDGLLPGDSVAPLARLVHELAGNEAARALVRRAGAASAAVDICQQVGAMAATVPIGPDGWAVRAAAADLRLWAGATR